MFRSGDEFKNQNEWQIVLLWQLAGLVPSYYGMWYEFFGKMKSQQQNVEVENSEKGTQLGGGLQFLVEDRDIKVDRLAQPEIGSFLIHSLLVPLVRSLATLRGVMFLEKSILFYQVYRPFFAEKSKVEMGLGANENDDGKESYMFVL